MISDDHNGISTGLFVTCQRCSRPIQHHFATKQDTRVQLSSTHLRISLSPARFSYLRRLITTCLFLFSSECRSYRSARFRIEPTGLTRSPLTSFRYGATVPARFSLRGDFFLFVSGFPGAVSFDTSFVDRSRDHWLALSFLDGCPSLISMHQFRPPPYSFNFPLVTSEVPPAPVRVP